MQEALFAAAFDYADTYCHHCIMHDFRLVAGCQAMLLFLSLPVSLCRNQSMNSSKLTEPPATMIKLQPQYSYCKHHHTSSCQDQVLAHTSADQPCWLAEAGEILLLLLLAHKRSPKT